MKKLLKKRLNQKGLTLIELLAVIVILAIIAAIAIPAIGGIIENSRVGAIKADAITAINAGNLYFTDQESVAAGTEVTIATLKSQGFLNDAGQLDDTMKVIYQTTGLEIDGQSKTIGGVNIDFNNASVSEINGVANSSATGDTNLVISRN